MFENPSGYDGSTRSASFPTNVNNILARFVGLSRKTAYAGTKGKGYFVKRIVVVLLIFVVMQSYTRQAEAIPIIIDNSTIGWDQTFGPDKFGQTITVPVGAVSFESITFFLGLTTSAYDVTKHFTVHIYLWDDEERHIIGSSLFDSTLQTVGPHTIEMPF